MNTTHPLEPGTDERPIPGRPPALELGDGSRLVLDEASASPIICRIDGETCERISLDDAMRLGGQPFDGYRRLRG